MVAAPFAIPSADAEILYESQSEVPSVPGIDGITADKAARANVALRAAADAIRRKDLDTAEAQFRIATQVAPTAPNGFLGLAEVARRRGDKAGVAKSLSEALKVAPSSSDANAAWARYLLTRGDVSGAITHLDTAIRADPNRVDLLIEEGDLQASVHHETEAATDYRAALATVPKNAALHYALGNALLASGQSEEAIVELKTAVDLEPKNVLGWSALGAAHLHAGQLDAALASFDAALKVKPDFLGAEIGRGDVLAMRGKIGEARAAYEAGAKMAPLSDIAWLRLGVLEEHQHHLADAEQDYRAARRARPGDPDTINNLAYVLAAEGHDLDEALALAKQATRIAPKNPNYDDTLAEIYRARHDYPDAVNTLKPIAQGRPILLYHLGLAYRDSGNKAKAGQAFDAALKLLPNFRAAKAARDSLSGPAD
ncbi:MAG TPA: tetratricopeptide repeat protein [Solirubrobacteraceae bacterium]|nr:tetratricopeptide repeat protein [Solirubrobacteraceae bacterium]